MKSIISEPDVLRAIVIVVIGILATNDNQHWAQMPSSHLICNERHWPSQIIFIKFVIIRKLQTETSVPRPIIYIYNPDYRTYAMFMKSIGLNPFIDKSSGSLSEKYFI